MTIHDTGRQELVLANDDVVIGLGYENGITLTRLSTPRFEESVLGPASPHIIVITIGEDILEPSDLSSVVVLNEDTQAAGLISVTFEQHHTRAGIRGRISVLDPHDGPVQLVVQLGVDWVDGVPAKMAVTCPFLATASEQPGYYRPGEGLGRSGPAVFSRYDFHEFPPAILHHEASESAFGFEFPSEFPLTQANCNREAWLASAAPDPAAHRIQVRPVGQLTDIVDMRLHASANGRNGVFESWKKQVRRKYDLRRYDLPGPRWCQRTYLHHFTYAYGKEIYDYDRNEIDVDRLLADGEEFGGYDALLYWHQYPRLGLDRRSQWELYDDLPAGLDTLRELVAACHDRGVRFFLPFKPWDVRASDSLDGQAAEIARLVEATGVDGFFLDTMATIPESFSALIRDRFPDLMFCSEGSPRRVREIQELTGSWDQITEPTTVEVNLFRFVFPEHPKNMIERWAVGGDKDKLIRRAVFNGCGLVIWQDVFGAWLPYSEDQKALIRQWKRVLSQYHETIFGKRSVPLIDTLVPGLLANRFANDPENRQIIALYNSTSDTISGPLLRIAEAPAAPCKVLWGDVGKLNVSSVAGVTAGVIINGSVAPGDVAVLGVETTE